MERPKILFALSDNVERVKLETVLRPLDIISIQAKDGAKVIERAIKELPAVIVTDMGLGLIGAEKVLSILRHNTHSSSIPFFFISDSALDIPGFKPGTDTFLLRPLNPEEVLSRFIRSIDNRSSRRTGESDIVGKLNQMSLTDILQFLNMNSREGELRVSRGPHRGIIFIQNGEVLNAVLEESEKEKALYRMLSWSYGEFEFTPCTVLTPRKIRASASTLLMEGLRQIDEYNRSISTLPDPEECLVLIKRKTVPDGLHPAAYELLRHLNYHAKVEELINRSTYPDFEVYSAITALINKGLVKIDHTGTQTNTGIFTIEESLHISEKLSARTAREEFPDTAKIFILSTSTKLVDKLLELCVLIPDFKVSANALASCSQGEGLGEVASLELTTGMEVLLFSVPVVHGMGPLLRAFSSNITGILLLTDTTGGERLEELVQERDRLVEAHNIPVLHLCAPLDIAQGLEEFQHSLSLDSDETLLSMNTTSPELVIDIFRRLFAGLLT